MSCTDKIMGDDTLTMQYKRYEELIVLEHGVILEGWSSSSFNPSKMALADLEHVWSAMENNECKWRRLTVDELQQKRVALSNKRSNREVEQRKERNNKGKP